MDPNETALIKLIGQRLLSEANDIKRTTTTIAKDLRLPENLIEKMIDGKINLERTLEIVYAFARHYPVKISDVLLDVDDTNGAIKIMTASESCASRRVYSRKNAKNNYSSYYEYRDTATSRLSPFRPEWIKELRIVNDSDPANPDVAYNEGHLMHQMTAFVGPVNFYWEIEGQKYCEQLNTGDSNFISPFWKHSFASRDQSKEALIIAVTFSGDVARARNEFYALGTDSINKFVLDKKNNSTATAQLLRQTLQNKLLTADTLSDLLKRNGGKININSLLDEETPKNTEELERVAILLGLPKSYFELSESNAKDEVIVRRHSSKESYIYNPNFSDYSITPLAYNPKLPQCLGFNFQIMSTKPDRSSVLESTLHSYLYNYGNDGIKISFLRDDRWETERINSGDSLYMKPNIPHKFWSSEKNNATIYIFRVPGYINVNLQKELTSFSHTSRLIETSSWFE
jgi:methylphosphonate synthase